ncbi:sigma factor-like helix-turn-helix DNA-binding protein [Paenibacillus sp. DMB20]|uniref:sigma factor-like helix-turn-helix DNA-binding protein n=1 Tax=Paenibacillus sp. DMB20 TaxID=1642570 RepID=UPI000627D519|nr:sigma factor-like helix-turn-helix DNA-binding protein [Paenibacillus sp. DMB20]KKO54502.1 RNA polymerase subunit sigma [Paenibacillus sp. DMB20]
MGVVKTDLEKQAREYEAKYALHSSAGVRALLKDRHHIAERRFYGDVSASDILLDLDSAITIADLTERQAETIMLIYGADLTQARVSEIMGITQKSVDEHIEAATEKIAAVFAQWEYGEVVAA